MLKVFLLAFALFLSACSDNAIVTTYDKTIAQNEIPCLRLVVFPPDTNLEKTLKTLYNFSDDCSFRLEASQKSGIVCNSTHNVEKKTLSNFPSSYLKLSILKNKSLVYGYYIDLKEDVTSQDVKDALKSIRRDLKLKN